MQRSTKLIRVAQLLGCLLVCKTIAVTLLSYRDYFPPNFRSDFLWGREAYFFGWYQWTFYVHIVSGPISLVVGMLLISKSVRQRFPARHRQLGRVQVAVVLLFVAPSGLGMAWHAMSGASAAVSFAILSLATGMTVALGWRAAVSRRFAAHQRWMTRCFVLLCSAVLLRVIGGLSVVLQFDGTYPLASWASWIIPLAVYECYWRFRSPVGRRVPTLK